MTAAATSSTPANRRALLTFLRLFAGLCILAGLAFFLWTPGAWQNKLFVWVLLTILADECAGWFGYAGVALGLIVLFAPGATPEQWFVILPLIGAALFALLLLKHSGGPFVLPFAGLIFTGAVLAADRVGGIIDTPIRLLGSPEFQRMSVLPMVIGLGVSFVRQSVSGLLRWSARRRVAASASASSTAATPAAPSSSRCHSGGDRNAPSHSAPGGCRSGQWSAGLPSSRRPYRPRSSWRGLGACGSDSHQRRPPALGNGGVERCGHHRNDPGASNQPGSAAPDRHPERHAPGTGQQEALRIRLRGPPRAEGGPLNVAAERPGPPPSCPAVYPAPASRASPR